MTFERREEISQAIDRLSLDSLAEYAEAPVPNATDEDVSRLVQLLATAPLGEREQVLYSWLEPEQLRALSVFAMRMCGLAVAERSPDLLMTAMVAQTFEGFRSIEDEAVAEVVLGTIRDCSTTLGEDPATLADGVARLGNKETAARLREFFGAEA